MHPADFVSGYGACCREFPLREAQASFLTGARGTKFRGGRVSRPRIAVVGSVDETRQFEPPVTDPGTARRACEELGGELAGAGWNLVVYSGRPSFVEADVVRGYLRSGMAPPRSIEVRAPLGKTGFDEFLSLIHI